MRITVCELPDAGKDFTGAWSRLAEHVRGAASQLVLLPDMPFASWFAGGKHFDSSVWQNAVAAHGRWEARLGELGAKYVLSSRPVDFGNERYDEGFVWDAEYGLRSVHAKAEFRNEQGAWENCWYRNPYADFTPLELDGLRVGFLIGAELANEAEARRYGEERVDVIAVPRGANRVGFDAWRDRAATLARASNAYVIAATRAGAFGGQGCIVAPTGEVLGVTSASEPFITREIEFSTSQATPVDLRELHDRLDPWETGVPPY